MTDREQQIELPAASRRPWIVLLLLFGAHLAFNGYCCPIGMDAEPSGGFHRLFFVGVMGISVVQGLLLAVAAAFGPGPWLKRVAVAASLALVLDDGITVATARNMGGAIDHGNTTVCFVTVLTYAVLLGPLFLWRLLRGWRILLAGSSATGQQRAQFSLQGLLLAVTALCVLAAAERYAFGLVRWPSEPQGWRQLGREAASLALYLAMFALPMLPVVGLVLARKKRWQFAIATLVGIAVQAAAEVLTEANGSDIHGMAALLCGAWLSAVITLFVVRFAGFRLVRVRSRIPPSTDSAVPLVGQQRLLPTTA